MTDTKKICAYEKDIAQTNRKVALVASLVRNRTVADAIVILSHTPKRAAIPVKKAIESAKANAINNHRLNDKSLIISTISVSTGSRIKRYMPASRGRALPFEKKMSNIFVELSGEKIPKKKPVKKPTGSRKNGKESK